MEGLSDQGEFPVRWFLWRSVWEATLGQSRMSFLEPSGCVWNQSHPWDNLRVCYMCDEVRPVLTAEVRRGGHNQMTVSALPSAGYVTLVKSLPLSGSFIGLHPITWHLRRYHLRAECGKCQRSSPTWIFNVIAYKNWQEIERFQNHWLSTFPFSRYAIKTDF